MSAAPDTDSRATPRPRQRVVLGGVVAAVGAAVVAVLIAQIGKAIGAAHVRQLMPASIVVLTVLGVAVASVVWALILNRAGQPARLLARLVPAVLLLSLIPDVLLGLTGTAWGAAVTLMAAHVGVFAVAVPVLVAGSDPRRP